MNNTRPSIFMSHKKKELFLHDMELNSHGIVTDNISIVDSVSKKSASGRFINCLIRSLLIFMASFGTIGGVVDAFELPYNPFIVIPAMMIISALVSLIYYNRLCFYLGYIGLFVVFALLTFSFYWYINSGFQAFLNTMYEKYSDFFAMSSLREGTEFITNRMLTISITMIYVGTFLAILLNITISGYMSLVETFLITFPILQVALYIDLKPSSIYLVLLIACYITVGIIHRSSHYRLPSIKYNKDSFITIRKKKFNYHAYLNCGKGILRLTIQTICFTAIVLLLCLNLFYSSFSSRGVSNKLKRTTDEYVKLFVQNGIMGFFDRYTSTGGLSEGRLGGVSSVRPDYKTDLIVRYVPYTTDTMYLKAFIGGDYVGNAFVPDGYEPVVADGYVSSKNKYALSEYTHPTFNYSKMQIENVDASTSYNYMPYDAVAANTTSGLEQRVKVYDLYPWAYFDDTYPGSTENLTYEVLYDPYIDADYYEPSPYIDSDYEEKIYNHYTDVPDYMLDDLSQICDEAGLTPLSKEYEKLSSMDSGYAASQSVRLEILNKLDAYYKDNYSYTMAPGTTPYGRDVVLHFLTKQKRGYCAHFASSATLLLRSLGIPARYVEGYMLSGNELANGVGISRDASDWISSEDFIEFGESSIIEVTITDANAHAWVEVYLDGYGWIPYEFTPPNMGEDLSDFAFADLFSGLMLTDSGYDVNNTDSDTEYTFNFNLSFGFIAWPLAIIVGLLILTWIIVKTAAPLIRLIRRHHYIKNGKYSSALIINYKSFVRKMLKKKMISKSNIPVSEVMNNISLSQDYSSEDFEIIEEIIQRSFFGKDQITADEYKKCSLFFADCIK